MKDSEINERLFADPSVRALLWCLLGSGKLTEEQLLESGFDREEARAILADPDGRLRTLRRSMALAEALTPEKLASLLRARLSEQIQALKGAGELASLLRSLRSLPDWLFPQWQQQNARKGNDGLAGLLGLAALGTGG
ncbi:MAG: hypothetical protein R3F46_05265 [bacterium]